jgi:hypothetical protein
MRKGDKVAFSRRFLQSTGQYTGWAPQARGVVIHVEPFGHPGLVHNNLRGPRKMGRQPHLCTVQWGDDSTHVSRVLDANLVLVDKLHLEPA